MYETFCFPMQSLSATLDDLPLRCDGCETVSYGLGSWSNRFRSVKWGLNFFLFMCGRLISIIICICRIVTALETGLQVVLVDELPMAFHCDLQLKDRSLTVNGIASGAGGRVADDALKQGAQEMR